MGSLTKKTTDTSKSSINTQDNVSGGVNIPTVFVTYHGVETNSATVAIDNTNRTIAVDVKPIAGNCINDVKVDGQSVVEDRVADINLKTPIKAAVKEETTRAKAAEQTITNTVTEKVATEKSERQRADASLTKNINDEITDRITADTWLATAINTTVGAVEQEAARAKVAELALQNSKLAKQTPGKLSAYTVSNTNENITTSISKTATADSLVLRDASGGIAADSIKVGSTVFFDSGDVNVIATKGFVTSKTNPLETRVTDEEIRAREAESTLSTTITNKITEEQEARAAADTILTAALTAESERAVAAETTISTSISNKVDRLDQKKVVYATDDTKQTVGIGYSENVVADTLVKRDAANNVNLGSATIIENGTITFKKKNDDRTLSHADLKKLQTNVPTKTEVNIAIAEVNQRIDNLDVQEVGGDSYYLSAIKQENGKIVATPKATVKTISEDSDQLTTSTAVKKYVASEINKLDAAKVGDQNSYLESISETNGKIIAVAQPKVTEITGATSGLVTEAAAKTYTDNAKAEAISKIGELNVPSVGAAGSYIKTVSETAGKVAATTQTFATDFNVINDNNAPTVKAVSTFVAEEINKLEVDNITNTANKTVASISEVNGKVNATFTPIKIEENQVTDLVSDLRAINEKIESLNPFGRYLSSWNCVTGLPTTAPATKLPYAYLSGDYYIIETVAASGGTNYMPDGVEYTGAASTKEITETLAANDYFIFDGTIWKLVLNSQKSLSFSNIAGQPRDNAALAEELTSIQNAGKLYTDEEIAKVNANFPKKQDKLISGTNIATINGQSLLNGIDITVVGPQGPQGPKGDKGDKGDAGISPHIGTNGNWWIGTTDTGIQAKGENGQDGRDGTDGKDGKDGKNGNDGVTPHIGTNGNWWIGTTDTGVKAQGEDGEDGQDGAPGQDGQDGAPGISPHIDEATGHWFIGTTDTGVTAKGEDGAPGQDGRDGRDGLTTSIKVNGRVYTQQEGQIDLPNYPSTEEFVSSEEFVALAAKVDVLDETKQDTLEAGTGIKIVDNVISVTAVDKGYSAGYGISFIKQPDEKTQIAVKTDVIATKEDLAEVQPKLSSVNAGKNISITSDEEGNAVINATGTETIVRSTDVEVEYTVTPFTRTMYTKPVNTVDITIPSTFKVDYMAELQFITNHDAPTFTIHGDNIQLVKYGRVIEKYTPSIEAEISLMFINNGVHNQVLIYEII